MDYSRDAFLAKETIRIYDLNDTQIKGEFSLLENGSLLQFEPDKQWQTPEIEIRIQSKLEDLAGNNLNRLFDTDISKKEHDSTILEIGVIRFKLPQ